jgi:hypothetical protein
MSNVNVVNMELYCGEDSRGKSVRRAQGQTFLAQAVDKRKEFRRHQQCLTPPAPESLGFDFPIHPVRTVLAAPDPKYYNEISTFLRPSALNGNLILMRCIVGFLFCLLQPRASFGSVCLEIFLRARHVDTSPMSSRAMSLYRCFPPEETELGLQSTKPYHMTMEVSLVTPLLLFVQPQCFLKDSCVLFCASIT